MKRLSHVFETHGITSGVRSQLLLIQELALAVSLQGRYAVQAHYHGAAHQLRVTIREGAKAGLENDQGLQRQLGLYQTFLPGCGREREAGDSLSTVTAKLDQLLLEEVRS